MILNSIELDHYVQKFPFSRSSLGFYDTRSTVFLGVY